MSEPSELSIAEIRNYMLENGCKVTNHALVKHFKKFLTHPDTQNEARKEFKTYVNILSTIKNENNKKYLILRKKYMSECPSDDIVQSAVAAAINDPTTPNSPGVAIGVGVGTGAVGSFNSEGVVTSPFRQPPPYKPPPDVSGSGVAAAATDNAIGQIKILPPAHAGIAVHQENVANYRECVNEFAAVVKRIDPGRLARQPSEDDDSTKIEKMDTTEQCQMATFNEQQQNLLRDNSANEQNMKENNIPRFSFSSGASATSTESSSGGDKASNNESDLADNPISVKEATRKFNRMASEEEAKIISPQNKKKTEKILLAEENDEPEVTFNHPKAKEWIVSMAKANYQELAKLANEFPGLVKLQDPATGYTALHWAAKHGNEDVIKLIAGTYKADVNARTNGGYTPLHLAMQFGRVNIFELLCNTYKANRDLMDWSGNKPLDYSKQRTTVSASTYSSEYNDMFNVTFEPNNPNNNNNNDPFGNNNYNSWNIWSSNFGGGGTLNIAKSRYKKSKTGNPLGRTQSLLTTSTTRRPKNMPIKSLINRSDDDLMPFTIPVSPETNRKNLNNNNNNNNQTDITKSSMAGTSEKSSNEQDNVETLASYKGSISSKDNYGTMKMPRRKESFLRKTLRAAAVSNKHKSDVVTNQALTE